MHELSLARELVEQVVHAAVREHAERVTRVVVAIGGLAGVDDDAFELAFPFATEGTLAESATLVIEKVPACAVCNQCAARFEPEIVQLMCPVCGATPVSVQGGREFLIRSVDLEVP